MVAAVRLQDEKKPCYTKKDQNISIPNLLILQQNTNIANSAVTGMVLLEKVLLLVKKRKKALEKMEGEVKNKNCFSEIENNKHWF